MTPFVADINTQANLRLYLITNDPEIADYACQINDLWPFVDLEYIGKCDRQGNVDSWKSHHTLDDVARVREAVPGAPILVRINPLNGGSKQEIDEVIARGADAIMLPMFEDLDTLSRFHDILRERALSVPLFETVGAIHILSEAVANQPMDALHIGLNDLSLELGLTFMFECISEGVLEDPAIVLRAAGMQFGIGGVGRVGASNLPATYILGEHVRLGSSAAILSRSFHGFATTKCEMMTNLDFVKEVGRLRNEYVQFKNASTIELEANRQKFVEKTNEVSRIIGSKCRSII